MHKLLHDFDHDSTKRFDLLDAYPRRINQGKYTGTSFYTSNSRQWTKLTNVDLAEVTHHTVSQIVGNQLSAAAPSVVLSVIAFADICRSADDAVMKSAAELLTAKVHLFLQIENREIVTVFVRLSLRACLRIIALLFAHVSQIFVGSTWDANGWSSVMCHLTCINCSLSV